MPNETTVVHCRFDTYDILIGRPTKWGNPYRIGHDGTRQEIIDKYREYIEHEPELLADAKRELKGKKLGCFCAPLSCHGDVLKEIADANR